MTPQERAEKHFDGYVGPMQRELLAHMVEVCMAMSRFHYVTSHVHGVKHEQQDARETARAAFTPVQEAKGERTCLNCGQTCTSSKTQDILKDCAFWADAPSLVRPYQPHDVTEAESAGATP